MISLFRPSIISESQKKNSFYLDKSLDLSRINSLGLCHIYGKRDPHCKYTKARLARLPSARASLTLTCSVLFIEAAFLSPPLPLSLTLAPFIGAGEARFPGFFGFISRMLQYPRYSETEKVERENRLIATVISADFARRSPSRRKPCQTGPNNGTRAGLSIDLVFGVESKRLLEGGDSNGP